MHSQKSPQDKSRSAQSESPHHEAGNAGTFSFEDNRHGTIAQRQLHQLAAKSKRVLQLKAFQELVQQKSEAKNIPPLIVTADRQPNIPLQMKGAPAGKAHPPVHRMEEEAEKKPVQKKLIDPQNWQASPVVQRVPADWAKAPMKNIEQHKGSAWNPFDSWWYIVGYINTYKAYPNAKLDQRRATLENMRTSIKTWKAHPNNTAVKGDARIKAILADIPTLETEVTKEFDDVAIETDKKLGGHSHTRHGADLTDDQLRKRLETKKDRAGHKAPATISSRFNSQALWTSTKNDAVKKLDAAKTATLAYLKAEMTAYSKAWKNRLAANTVANKKAVIAARKALDAKIKTIPNPSADKLQATGKYFHLPDIPGGVAAGVDPLVAKVPETTKRYSISVDAKKVVGTAWEKYKVGGAWKKKVGGGYDSQPSAAPKGVTTVLEPGIQPFSGLPSAANWKMVTHFPSAPPLNPVVITN
jgi:hypothetical protein